MLTFSADNHWSSIIFYYNLNMTFKNFATLSHKILEYHDPILLEGKFEGIKISLREHRVFCGKPPLCGMV